MEQWKNIQLQLLELLSLFGLDTAELQILQYIKTTIVHLRLDQRLPDLFHGAQTPPSEGSQFPPCHFRGG